MKPIPILLSILLLALSAHSAPSDSTERDSEYRIERPGTITFTVGITIKGKVEKPQVVIFLPKERPFFREFSMTRSFRPELLEPVPVQPRDQP